MESAIIIVAIILLFWFKASIKGLATTAEKVVSETNGTIDDSIQTYANEIYILNAEKRSEQMARIAKLKARVTNSEIRALIENAEVEEDPATVAGPATNPETPAAA